LPIAATGSYGRAVRADDDGPSGVAPAAEGFALGSAVADMYTDLQVGTLLRRLLAHSRELLHTVAGSISLVDTAHGRYDKIAEDGVSCRLGGSFPLNEGATGQAFARRMPVVVDDYSAVYGSHLPPGHPVGRGAAAAAPLWWRGEVIGVNVAFAGRRRRFTTAEIDAFELLTQSVASAVIRAGAAEPALAGLLREDSGIGACDTGFVAGWGTLLRADGPRTDGPGSGAQGGRPPERAAAPLTRRETEVLRLLADGLSDRGIAARLGISAKTVEKHVGAVLRKTGTMSRTAAVVHALGRGWLGEVPDAGASAHR
jgi:DNA-binding CsgD family transcriptional regulator